MPDKTCSIFVVKLCMLALLAKHEFIADTDGIGSPIFE